MIYLDNAATTIKKPDAVYDAVLDAMKHCGNSGRGMSDASLDASRKIYEARMCLTEFFGGEDADRRSHDAQDCPGRQDMQSCIHWQSLGRQP